MSIEVLDPIKGKSADEVAGYLRAESKKLQDDYAGKVVEKDGKKTYNLTVPELEAYRERQSALGEVGKYLETLRKAEKDDIEQRRYLEHLETQPERPISFNGGQPNNGFSNGANNLSGAQAKSLGQLLVESREFKSGAWRNGNISFDLPDAEFKTTMSTSAGFANPNDRTNVVTLTATRRPLLQQFIPQIPTDVDTVKYMEETTFTNNVAATTEGNAPTDSALAYTERSQAVETVFGWLPVTEQQLQVASMIQGLIDSRLRLQYELSEETEIINGDGSAPNLTGYYIKSGIQTQALGGDARPDAVFKTFTKLRGGGGSGFVEPELLVIHPNDWQDFRLLTDANGNYIWGNPAEAGPERIWGVRVLQTTAATEGTALSGDFSMHSAIYRRQGVRVEIGYNSDDFTKLKRTIRVYGRLALVIYRAAAFATTTGL